MDPVKTLIATVLFIFFFSSPLFAETTSHQETIDILVDIQKVAKKSPAEVEKVLGKPDNCQKLDYGLQCRYAKTNIEIIFTKGKADLITINNMGGAAFDKKVLAILGLPVKEPSLNNSFVMLWQNIEGLLEVTIFPFDGKANHAYIRVFSK